MFGELAEMEEAHRRGGAAPRRAAARAGRWTPPPARWRVPTNFDEEEARSPRLTPYRALAIAVRNEERAFAFYSYVAAEAGSPVSGRWPRIWRVTSWSTPPSCVGSVAARSAASDPHVGRSPAMLPRCRTASIGWERDAEAAQGTAGADRCLSATSRDTWRSRSGPKTTRSWPKPSASPKRPCAGSRSSAGHVAIQDQGKTVTCGALPKGGGSG